MRRSLIVAAGIVALGVGWLFRTRGAPLVEELVRREIVGALPGEVSFEAIDAGFVPLRVTLRALEVRSAGRRVLAAGRVTLWPALFESLWEGNWIGDVEIADLEVAYAREDRFWADLARGGAGGGGFRPRVVRLRSGRLEADLAAWRLAARAEVSRLDARLSGVLEPRMEISLAARGEVERGGARLEARRIEVGAEAGPGGVTIRQAAVDGEWGALRGSGRVEGEAVEGAFDWEGTLEPIFALLPEAPEVRGGGRVVGELRGSLDQPKMDAELEARAVRIGGVEFSGRGRLRTRGRRFELAPAHAALFGGEVEGRASGRFVPGIPFRVRGRFSGWDPASFIRVLGAETPVRGKWSGEAELRGLLLGEELDGSGEFALAEGGEALAGRVSFSVREQAATVEGRAESSAGDRLLCQVRFRDDSLEGDLEASGDRLAAFAPFVGADFAASGKVTGQLAGTTRSPALGGVIDLRSFSARGLDFGPIAGRFTLTTEIFRTDRLEARLLGAEARGAVALGPAAENDWRVTIREASLAEISRTLRIRWTALPDLAGRLTGQLVLGGPWAAPRVTSRFSIAGGEISGEQIGAVEGKLALADRSWTARATLAGAGGTRGEATAALDAEGRLVARLDVSDWPLGETRALSGRLPGLRGRASVQAELRGDPARPLGEGTLVVRDFGYGDESIGEAAVRVRLEKAGAAFEGKIGDRAEFSGSIDREDPHAFRVAASWADLDLAPLLLPRLDLVLASEGKGALEGDSRAVFRRGTIELARLAARRERRELSNRSPVVVTIRDGGLEIGDSVFAGDGQEVTIAGRVGPDRSEIRARGRADLGVLELVSEEIASAAGELSIDATLVRDGGGPWRYRGRGRIDRGALDVAFLVGLSDLAGSFEFEDRGVRVERLSGRIGGGEFFLEGRTGLDSGWDLGWGLREASLGIPEWLDYRASGGGRVAGPFDLPTIAGDIEIREAMYDRRIEWSEFLPWFRRQTRPAERARAWPLRLDLGLHAAQGLFVDNNLASVELAGDLRLGGSAGAPVGVGRLEVLEGQVSFRRSRFELTAGSLQFAELDPWNPTLEVRGETTVETRDADYEIQLHASGTAADPRVEFTASDPSLTENDVLALVTFGRTVAQLQAEGAGIELEEVLALTAGRYATPVESRFRSLVPVDRIEIEPTFSRTTGTTEPRLSIGKDLTREFHAVLGTGLGSERRQELLLEYDLTRRISVQGSWESQTESDAGAFGGDLKFHREFWGLSDLTLLPRGAGPSRETPSRAAGEAPAARAAPSEAPADGP